MRGKLCIALLALSVVAPVSARDVISSLLKDSVATLSDAADLIYYSFKSIGSGSGKEVADLKKSEEGQSPENVTRYLQEKGINLPKDNQPISRQQFAKILIQRYGFKTSFKTTIFGRASDYFHDAVRLGIFSTSSLGHESLSTRELVNAFLRADAIGRKR